MASQLTVIFMAFGLFQLLLHSFAVVHGNLEIPKVRFRRFGEDDGPLVKKPEPMQISCDEYASCASDVDHNDTCFCDRHCQLFGDCCPDFVDEVEAEQLAPLPSESFVCNQRLGSVSVITDCPESYDAQFVRDGCRHGSATTGLQPSKMFYYIPASSRRSGLVYRNVYCALCRGEEDLGFWEVATERCEPKNSTDDDQQTESADVEDIDDLMRRESFIDECLFKFSPPSDVPEPRRCFDVIDSCTVDDAELATRCTQPSAIAFVFDRNGLAYRNRDCAACNGIADYDLVCNSTAGTDKRKPDIGSSFGSFAIVLDLNVGKGSTVGGRSMTQRLGSCEQGYVYDPFAGTCRAIACPPGHSFTEGGQCIRHSSHPPGSKYQPLASGTDDDCAWIQFRSSEYRMLSNWSIYVPVHEIAYASGSYELDANRTAYICTAFQRNYTVPEALVVDSVGTYLSVICSVISLLALAFQFGVYMAFPVLRNTPGRCVICLIVSLFIAQLLFLLVKAGSFVSQGFCFGQAVVMHYAFLAAFFWMNVMAIDVRRTFSSTSAVPLTSPSSARRRFLVYSAYAWLSTAAVVGLAVVLDLTDVGAEWRPHYGRSVCWFGSRAGLLLLFGVPVGVLLVANVIMFILSVRQIRSASKASQMAVQKTDHTRLLVIYVKLSVVMGLGWVLGFIAAFTDQPALWYIFIIVNSLQGVLLCAAFVMTRQVLKLLAECARPLWRRATTTAGCAPSGSNEFSLSPKSPSALQTQGDSTRLTTVSSP